MVKYPESKRPLKDRYNIILSRNHSVEESNGVKCFSSLKDAFEFCKELKGEIFVIGGSQIFNECCKTEHYENLNKIYLTRFDDNYHPRNTTHSFPLKLLENMKLVDQSEVQHEICSRPHIDNREKGFLQEYLSETYTRSVSFHF